MKRSAKVAISGVFSALALVCMLFTIFPYATYALAGLAGAILLPVALECGKTWAFGAYGVVSLLSFLLAPDMESKLLFVAFFGYYPILKLILDRLNRVAGWTIKLAMFNATMVGSYLLLLYVFGLPADSFELFGVNLPLLFLLVGNVVFWLYDRVLSGFVVMYCTQWHDRIAHLLHYK